MTVSPTVLLLNEAGEEKARYEGEGQKMRQALQAALDALPGKSP